MAKSNAPSEEKSEAKNDGEALAGLIGKLSNGIAEHKQKFDTMDDIKFPVEISDVKGHFSRPKKGVMTGIEVGALVRIRPCAEQYKEQTFLGMYIGEIPIDVVYEREKATGVLHVRTYNNCAFYVFELSTVIFGCESWWAELKDDDDVDRMITDADIENVPYVQVLKAMVAAESGKEDNDASNEDS